MAIALTPIVANCRPAFAQGDAHARKVGMAGKIEVAAKSVSQ
jgi:hypothetical protein